MNSRAQTPRFLAVDFFCGAGGTTRGLISAGGMVLAGIDNESSCKTTYEKNNHQRFGPPYRPKFLNFDIFKKTPNYPSGQQHELVKNLTSLVRAAKKNYPGVPLLFSICAPCQPFARLSKQGVARKRYLEHIRDRSLLLQCLKIVRQFKPDFVFCENVAGITSSQYGEVWQTFEHSLRKMRYRTGSGVVNAVDFGIAQYRKRSILIGMRVRGESKGRESQIELPLKDAGAKRKTVSQVIGHLPALRAGEFHAKIPNHATRNLSKINSQRLECAQPGGSNAYLKNTKFGDLSLNCHQKVRSRLGMSCFGDVYTRMHPDKPSPTITTRCLSISNGRFAHYDTKQVRPISIREAALLQSFPSSYIFYPTDELETPARMIGNAVPPRLARYFAKHLLRLSAASK